MGDNATAHIITAGAGNDTIYLGKNAKLSGIDGGSEIDTLNTQTTGFHTRNIEAINVVCYAPGTLIDTPDGSRAV